MYHRETGSGVLLYPPTPTEKARFSVPKISQKLHFCCNNHKVKLPPGIITRPL